MKEMTCQLSPWMRVVMKSPQIPGVWNFELTHIDIGMPYINVFSDILIEADVALRRSPSLVYQTNNGVVQCTLQ